MSEKSAKKNKLFHLVDKAPFAGKFSVKDSYLNYVTAPDERKTKKALGSAAFLGFMVAVHAYQAKIGLDSLAVHGPEMLDSPDAKNIIFSGIDGMYATAMGAVALRQADLLRKVGQKHYNWIKAHKKLPEAERPVQKYIAAHNKRAVAVASGVTLAGQIAGVIPYIDAQIHNYKQSQQNQTSVEQYYAMQNPSDDMYETNTVPLVVDHGAVVRQEASIADYELMQVENVKAEYMNGSRPASIKLSDTK